MANTNTKELRKFGMLDKLSYAAGDFGCNMSFALKGTLTTYWTQFMGVNQMGMAGLLLLVQIWDAINDPVIGSMVDADRRHYKRNKFLAYINVGAIGLTVAGRVLLPAVPPACRSSSKRSCSSPVTLSGTLSTPWPTCLTAP